MFPVEERTWDPAAGERLAFLAVVHSAEDPAQAKLVPPPQQNFQSVLTAVTLDNNVTVLVTDTGNPPCNPTTITIIILLLILATILIVYIISRWRRGLPVPVLVYIALTITIIILILIVICTEVPECIA